MIKPTYGRAVALAFLTAALCAVQANAAATVIPSALDRAGVRDLGSVPANTRIDLAVVLPFRNDRQLDGLIAAQSDPVGPAFRHFLTAPEFVAAFAPARRDVERVAAELRMAGLTVGAVSATRNLIEASGSAAVVNRVFGTAMHRVAQAGVGERYANARAATLPPALREAGADVVGLDDLQAVRPTVQPQVIGQPLTGPSGGYGPLATAQGYDMPVQHGFDGSGRATGVIMCGDFKDSDLKQFLRTFNVERTGPPTRRVEVNGGAPWYPPSNDPVNCSLEASLDVETVVGNTPGTALSMYLVPTRLAIKDIIDTLDRVVADNVVDVLSSSLAGCETQTGHLGKLAEKIARQGAAEGITFASSTGDAGSNECGSGGGVVAPADAPTWMAIGGTTLQIDANGNYIGERGASFGGGGFSAIFARPPYQKRLPNTLPNGRNEPDLAFSAVNVDVAYAATFRAVSGTSWSAPVYSALQTQIDDVIGSRAGFVNPAIYRLARRNVAGVFHDVTAGNNGLYTAGPGYDNVTGIGSADGYALAQALK